MLQLKWKYLTEFPTVSLCMEIFKVFIESHLSISTDKVHNHLWPDKNNLVLLQELCYKKLCSWYCQQSIGRLRDKMRNFICFIFSLLFTGFWSVDCAEICTKYCVCSIEMTECYFDYTDQKTCVGQIPMIETYILKVHGPFCESARTLWQQESIFQNTVLILSNAQCEGLRNCR